MSELSTTLVIAINDAHALSQGSDQIIRDAIIEKCNRVRACGLLLMEAKASIGHGNFSNWIRDNLTFSCETAQLYMRYARANPQPIAELQDGILCLRDALVASGALSSSGHESQNRSTLTWLDHFTSVAMKLTGFINGQIEKSGGDVAAWPDEQRQAAKRQLQPIVDLYNRF